MNKGFSSIYVILCLAALMLFLLCVCEACSGYAAGSICENVCLVAGESVLSEYQSELQARYGIFALSSHEQKLEPLCRFYISRNLSGANILVRPALTDCSISCEGFYGLDTQALAQQIDALGLMTLGKDVLDETGALALLKEMLQPLSQRKDQDAAQQVAEASTAGSQGGSGKSPAQLMQDYFEATHPDLDEREGKSLVSVQKDLLPTALLGVKPSSSLLKYAASALAQDGISSGALLQARYITSVCGNAQAQKDDTLLGLETEYILFGKDSDRENEKEMKDALFKIRTAINLARFLSSEAKLSGYAAQASLFPAVPAGLAIVLLAAIDAAAEAKKEVFLLCSGGIVPIAPGAVPGADRFGSYQDYAALLLMLLPEQTRLARLMDIMQINVAYMEEASFAFQDYCYGFCLHAEFQKKSFLPDLWGIFRKGSVQQTHRYR